MSGLSEAEAGRISRLIVRESMGVGRRPDGRFESVRVMFNSTDPSCVDFAQRVEQECWRVGAYAIALPYSSQRERLRHRLTPSDSLASMNPLAKALNETVDVTIFIGEQENPAWVAGLDGKMRLTAPIRQQLREILDERKVRWLFLGWPIPGTARYYGVPLSRFRRIFFNCIRESFRAKMRSVVTYYERALSHAHRVHITADDGTDLEFSVEGRPVLLDKGRITAEDVARGDVGLNIPSGEVFLAPIEDSANGVINFETAAIPGFGKVEGLRLTFKDGRVRRFKASQGEKSFTRFLDANTGDKDRIGELGVGCNPAAEYTGGCIIIDEKIYRTLHIAIGSNTGSYHGKNRASSHLDMIKNMTGGEMRVDDTPVMVKGEPAAKS